MEHPFAGQTAIVTGAGSGRGPPLLAPAALAAPCWPGGDQALASPQLTSGWGQAAPVPPM
jgi:hypothetical protein